MGIINKIRYLFSPFFDNRDSLEIKKFASSVISIEEFKELNIGFVQYSNNYLFSKKLKLSKESLVHAKRVLRVILNPNVGGSYNATEGKIYLYLDNVIKPIRLSLGYRNKVCTRIVNILFHEYRHREQYSASYEEDFDLIFCDISMTADRIRKIIQYKSAHNSFYHEIDANVYGSLMAKNFFDKRVSKKDRNRYYDPKWLGHMIDRYQYDKCVFDYDRIFTLYNKIRNSCSSLALSNIVLVSKDKRWHKVFYGNKNKLRDINEIVNDSDFDKVDNKFINYVFTSKYFNSRLDYSSLSPEIIRMLIWQFNIRRNELYSIIHFVTNNNTVNSSRKIDDLKRLNSNMKYYNKKILELSNLLKKRKGR